MPLDAIPFPVYQPIPVVLVMQTGIVKTHRVPTEAARTKVGTAGGVARVAGDARGVHMPFSVRDCAVMGPCGRRLRGWPSSAAVGEHGCPHSIAWTTAPRVEGCPFSAAGRVDIAIGIAAVNTTQPLGFYPGARHWPPGFTAPACSANTPGQPSSSFVPWHFTR